MNAAEQAELLTANTVDCVPAEGLLEKLEKSEKTGVPLRVKLGIDPTASDIHLGFSVVLRKLKQFQDLGHQPVLIIGDYTARVGDPSGRNSTRPMLTLEEVKVHAATYLEQIGFILDMERVEVRWNGSWFEGLSFAELLNLMSQVTVARLLERDDFHKRYDDGVAIHLHEFLYPIMQAYDSVAVKADLELGGTDQLFNLILGRRLQEAFEQEPQICLTTPLLVGTDGTKKMSKSLGNYIGITEPPREIFGKTMKIADELMESYYRLLTDIPEDEVDAILSGHPNEAKLKLAETLVELYNGAEARQEEREWWDRHIREDALPDDVPEHRIEPGDLKDDGTIWIVKLLVDCGFAGSNSEARRLVQQGGVKLDGEAVETVGLDFAPADGQLLQVGSHRFASLVVSG